jgi:drug/metabolite transporter (DMT)-like permease
MRPGTQAATAAPGVRPVDMLLMAVGVIGVSTSGPLIAACAAPVIAVAFWRTALATAGGAAFVLARQADGLAALRGRSLRLTVAAGVLLAGHFATWVTSLRMTSVASATALVCLQAGWAVLFSWFAGERPTRPVVVGLLVALVGVLVVSGVDFSISTRALAGDVLALVGGVFSGAYVVLGGQVRRTTSTAVYTTVCYFTCSVLLLVGCLAAGFPLSGYAARDWVYILALTLFAQVLGHSVFNHLLARTSPTVVALVILVEVPGAALLAAAFLGQVPPLGVFAGLVLVLAGVALVVTGARTPALPVPPD